METYAAHGIEIDHRGPGSVGHAAKWRNPTMRLIVLLTLAAASVAAAVWAPRYTGPSCSVTITQDRAGHFHGSGCGFVVVNDRIMLK